jgi:hypothetical protein
MKDTIQKQRERLLLEQEQLRRKWDRLRKENEKDQKRMDTIPTELRRLEFVELIGKPGAVKLRYREQSGDRCFHLNDLRGTVLQVRRTRALVDFGAAGASTDSKSGRWNVYLCNLATTDKPQGELLNLGAL